MSLQRREGHFREGKRLGPQEDECRGNGAPPEEQGENILVSPKNLEAGGSAHWVREATERVSWSSGVRHPCRVSLVGRGGGGGALYLYVLHMHPRELDGKSQLFLLMIPNSLSIEIGCH